jgi:hypothetical protein
MTLIAPSTVRAEVTFRAISGALYDPSAVRFRLRSPAGTVESWTYQTGPEIVRASTGVFSIDVTLTTSGVWTWRWEGGDTVSTTTEGSVTVAASKVVA